MLARKERALPGTGLIHARLLPPNRLTLPAMSFSYPLKLIASTLPNAPTLTVYMLSYGGGLVSDDQINLKVILDEESKLCLLTQGSTKIFKRAEPTHITRQTLSCHLAPCSSLILIPDPIQPFGASHYVQHQTFDIPADETASLIILDWITEGRPAFGERWTLNSFESRNEIYTISSTGKRRLLLRDAVTMHNNPEEGYCGGEELFDRMDGMSCIATVIIRGPKFVKLAANVLETYKAEQRIGGRNFDKRKQEDIKKRSKGLLWTAASVRGCVLIKVSGPGKEEIGYFIRELFVWEGMESEVVKEFGDRSLESLAN
ncbi:hypothetical protein RUND412_010743 [Rhizina undulata]